MPDVQRRKIQPQAGIGACKRSSRWASRAFSHRRRLHQLAQVERRAGRARPRLGRGVAGRVFAGHHRSRSVALRPPVERFLNRSACRCPISTSTSASAARSRFFHRVREAESTARQSVSQIATFGRWRRARWCAASAVMEWRTPDRRARESSFLSSRASASPSRRTRMDRAWPSGKRRGGDARAAGARRAARGSRATSACTPGAADRAGQAHRFLSLVRGARTESTISQFE